MSGSFPFLSPEEFSSFSCSNDSLKSDPTYFKNLLETNGIAIITDFISTEEIKSLETLWAEDMCGLVSSDIMATYAETDPIRQCFDTIMASPPEMRAQLWPGFLKKHEYYVNYVNYDRISSRTLFTIDIINNNIQEQYLDHIKQHNRYAYFRIWIK